MQKEGKKVSITVYFEEKITIDHRTTTFRKAQSGETAPSEHAIAEYSDQEPGRVELIAADGQDRKEDFE